MSYVLIETYGDEGIGDVVGPFETVEEAEAYSYQSGIPNFEIKELQAPGPCK